MFACVFDKELYTILKGLVEEHDKYPLCWFSGELKLSFISLNGDFTMIRLHHRHEFFTHCW